MSTAGKILELLKNGGEQEISSTSIREHLGISRNAVWKHVRALREQGYLIEGHSRCGYRLVASPDRPDAAEVQPLLRTQNLGRKLLFAESTESTNYDASAGAEAGCDDGTVYCAASQVSGRGRMNRHWFSPEGVNLYFSMVLRPDVPISQAPSLPLVVGVSVATVLEKHTPGLKPQLKWPNDILINGKKICGILCEMQAEIDCRLRYIIAGVGINLNLRTEDIPEELRDIATSLRIESGVRFSRAKILAEVLNEFELDFVRWQKDGFAPFTGRIEKYDALIGREITVQQGSEMMVGRASGVYEDGALKLRTDNGFVPVYSGETKIVAF